MIRLEIKNYNIILTEKQQNISVLSSGKTDKYGYLKHWTNTTFWSNKSDRVS